MPPVSTSKASIAEPRKIASATSNRVMFSTKPTCTLSGIFEVHDLRTVSTARLESKLDSYSPPLQELLLGSYALVSILMKKRKSLQLVRRNSTSQSNRQPFASDAQSQQSSQL
ncbi:hypothetical protein BOTCAL_0044g00020 [Botryotinia calthae]|uniref:Uncharacterized protein n=1 Tax=Botryotinia calthae TaxID=38488 RepID=A0A4Y8DBU3_9HELO|nr:hypothetical protein BOTCAL_0044g00020 [Botryotinia calthae]